MSTISAQLRKFKEPGNEQPLLFFAVLPSHAKGMASVNTGDGLHKMEINAVLSLATEGAEDSYVRTTQPWPLGRVMLTEEYRRESYISPLCISLLPRQKVCPVHDPTVHAMKGRAIEHPCWCLCTQSFNVAQQKIVRLRLDPGYPSVTSLRLERLLN